jgi:hypothetical protein
MSALPNFPPALYSPEAMYATRDEERCYLGADRAVEAAAIEFGKLTPDEVCWLRTGIETLLVELQDRRDEALS